MTGITKPRYATEISGSAAARIMPDFRAILTDGNSLTRKELRRYMNAKGFRNEKEI